MLRPIPAQILRSTATVEVCNGVDMYQKQSFDTYTVEHVHLQPTDRITKTLTNTDHELKSILFVDVRRSTPALDWHQLLETAHENSGDMFVTVRGVKYTVLSVDGLRDDTDMLHHWEIGLG